MRARILDAADVLRIVDLLRTQGYDVLAPFSGRGRDTYFDTVTDANRSRIGLHLANPYYPPKRYVLPHIEPWLDIRREAESWSIEQAYDAPKRALFGIRSCDIADLAPGPLYLGRSSGSDYERRRRSLFLVNSSARSRATSARSVWRLRGHGRGADHFDLQLPDLGGRIHGGGGTEVGEALFAIRCSARGAKPTWNGDGPWCKCAAGSRPPPAGSPPRSATSPAGRSWTRPSKR
jgi:hypothetical protein